MSPVIDVEAPTTPTRRQAQGAQTVAAQQGVKRLREMEEFFKSLPDRRAGLGPVPDNTREMADDDEEATQS